MKRDGEGDNNEGGGSVLEVKHLAAELVDVGVNKDELVGGLE